MLLDIFGGCIHLRLPNRNVRRRNRVSVSGVSLSMRLLNMVVGKVDVSHDSEDVK